MSTWTTDDLVDKISAISSAFHAAGTVSDGVLRAIARHSGERIPFSVESGSGRTTLLFSHLSQCHKVFAVDAGNSISAVRRTEMFNSGSVEFIEGPTQVPLPRYVFDKQIHVAML